MRLVSLVTVAVLITACSSGASPGGSPDAACAEPDGCVDATPAVDAAPVGECDRARPCGDPARPVCDAASATCRTCQAHAECPSDACDLATGACLAEADVLYVTAGAIGSDCTRDVPCGRLRDAVARAAGSRTSIRLHAGRYPDFIGMSNGTISIYGERGAELVTASHGASVLSMIGGTLAIHEVSFDLSDSFGSPVECERATLSLDRVALASSSGVGLYGVSCMLTIDRSTILHNRASGLELSGGSARITNSVIARNGGTSADAGVAVRDGAAAQLEHDTIVDNSAFGFGETGGVACLAARATIHDSIVYGNSADPGVAGQISPGCTATHSLIGPESVPGPGNLSQAPAFVDASGNDFHLAAGSPGIDVGEASDVSHDLDGDARPLGAAPDLGADEVVP